MDDLKPCVLQSLLNIDAVPFVYIAAAHTALGCHPCSRTVESDLLRFQRQYAVVFQKHDSFRCHLVGKAAVSDFPLGGLAVFCSVNFIFFHSTVTSFERAPLWNIAFPFPLKTASTRPR